MVISGTVVIVEPDPTVGSIWTEVAAFAGFAADVVPRVPEARMNIDVHALIVRVSPQCHRVPAGWKAERRPRLIALVPAECIADLDLEDFDIVLPCDGQVRALYGELQRLAAAM